MIVCTSAEPHKLECIRPRTVLACSLLDGGNDAWVALLKVHAEHIGGVMLSSLVDSLIVEVS